MEGVLDVGGVYVVCFVYLELGREEKQEEAAESVTLATVYYSVGSRLKVGRCSLSENVLLRARVRVTYGTCTVGMRVSFQSEGRGEDGIRSIPKWL